LRALAAWHSNTRPIRQTAGPAINHVARQMQQQVDKARVVRENNAGKFRRSAFDAQGLPLGAPGRHVAKRPALRGTLGSGHHDRVTAPLADHQTSSR